MPFTTRPSSIEIINEEYSVTVGEDKLSWLRESLEWQKDMQDPDEFLNTLKTELFEDEVYVFTPKGDIKVLPKSMTDGYGAWWHVGIASTSSKEADSSPHIIFSIIVPLNNTFF